MAKRSKKSRHSDEGRNLPKATELSFFKIEFHSQGDSDLRRNDGYIKPLTTALIIITKSPIH